MSAPGYPGRRENSGAGEGATGTSPQLKEAEEEIRQHRIVLARLNRLARLEQLTGAIAHELNQPLTGILSNAQAAEILIKAKGMGRKRSGRLLTRSSPTPSGPAP